MQKYRLFLNNQSFYCIVSNLFPYEKHTSSMAETTCFLIWKQLLKKLMGIQIHLNVKNMLYLCTLFNYTPFNQ